MKASTGSVDPQPINEWFLMALFKVNRGMKLSPKLSNCFSPNFFCLLCSINWGFRLASLSLSEKVRILAFSLPKTFLSSLPNRTLNLKNQRQVFSHSIFCFEIRCKSERISCQCLQVQYFCYICIFFQDHKELSQAKFFKKPLNILLIISFMVGSKDDQSKHENVDLHLFQHENDTNSDSS